MTPENGGRHVRGGEHGGAGGEGQRTDSWPSSSGACRYLQVGDPVLDQVREIFRLLHSPLAHAVRLAEVVEVCHDGPADKDVTLSPDAFNTPGYLTQRDDRTIQDGCPRGTE